MLGKSYLFYMEKKENDELELMIIEGSAHGHCDNGQSHVTYGLPESKMFIGNDILVELERQAQKSLSQTSVSEMKKHQQIEIVDCGDNDCNGVNNLHAPAEIVDCGNNDCNGVGIRYIAEEFAA